MAKKAISKMFFGCFVLLCVFVLMMSSSRGAWVGALCSGMVFFILAVQQGKITILFHFFLLMSLGLLGLYIYGFDFYIHLGKRVEMLPAMFEGEILDDSGQHRLHLLNEGSSLHYLFPR